MRSQYSVERIFFRRGSIMQVNSKVAISISLAFVVLAVTAVIIESESSVDGTTNELSWNWSAAPSTNPTAQEWDTSNSFSIDINKAYANLMGGSSIADEKFKAKITLAVGDLSDTKVMDAVAGAGGSAKGSDLSAGNVIIAWTVEDGTNSTFPKKFVNLHLVVKSSGAINAEVITITIKLEGTATNGSDASLSHTVTLNLKKSSSHAINFVCSGGSVYAYPAVDVETTPTDAENESTGRITSSENGKLVRISPFPSTTGMIKSISVKDASNTDVPVTTKSYKNTVGLGAPEYWYYFFTMPDSDVTVTVEFNSNMITVSSQHGSVTKKMVGNFLGPVNPASGAGYSTGSFQLLRQSNYYFEKDVLELTPTPDDGYEFKSWNVKSGGVTIADNRFTMGSSDVIIEAVFEEIQTQPQVPEVSSITCTGSQNGSNILLNIQIDGKNDVTSMQDPRLFIAVKYGDGGTMVINYYSKPELTNGVGSDVAIFSAQGLYQVIVELVDGVSNGMPADCVCFCHYEPVTA